VVQTDEEVAEPPSPNNTTAMVRHGGRHGFTACSDGRQLLMAITGMKSRS